jgi:translation elongation factor EF-Tu-like GTPase
VNKLKPQKADWNQIGRLLDTADRKLVAAGKILAIDDEACLQQAYKAIIQFVDKHLGKKHAGLVAVFDRMRRQRNLALYDTTGFISRTDAEEALKAARQYLTVIRTTLEKKKP